jgi:GDSL-like Lipase/Acylhydrolase
MRHPSFAGAILLAAAVSATASAQTFNVYVAVGASHDAGFTNATLVESHQLNSYPALIARQAGVQGFELPLVSDPGLPTPELQLVSLVPSTLIAPKALTPGTAKNAGLSRAYNNMSVPGATSVDVATTLTGGLHDLILRGRGTQLAQAAGLRPTFVTIGFVAGNDVLGAVLRGRAVDGVTMVPLAATRAAYQQIVSTLKATGARVVATNIPDVTALPFATTLKPVVVNPATNEPLLVNGQTVPLIGPSGALPANSYLLLSAGSLLARGEGIPTSLGGRGTPLPDEVVLDPAEITTIRDRVSAINQMIRDVCTAASIPVVDAFGLLNELATIGREFGGVRLSATFLTGGIFGYDGVHLTDLGQAVFANEWIHVINANGGGNGGQPIPDLDLAPFMGLATGSAAAANGPRGFELSREAYEALLELYPEGGR